MSAGSNPLVSICEITTMPATFVEDLAAYQAAGVDGIGLVESKLQNEPNAAAMLRGSGLKATHCVPLVPSILPSPMVRGPETPCERVDSLCASVRRFAEFDPVCMLFITGPGEEKRRTVIESLRRIADEADRAGVRVALEPCHPSLVDGLSFVESTQRAVDLLDEADVPSIGVLFDVWHLWEDEDVYAQIDEHVARIYGVHVNDRREVERSPFDRVLPGDGILPLGPLLRRLDDAGYAGYYDVEIFSDNGLIVERFPDSLWDTEPAELAHNAREAFLRVWAER